MRIRTKLTTGLSAMTVLVVICGVSGYLAVGSLGRSLAWVSGPAHRALAGLGAALVAVEGEMLAVQRVLDGETSTARASVEAAEVELARALDAVGSSGVIESGRLEALRFERVAYLDALGRLLAAHDEFVTARDAFVVEAARFVELGEVLEEVGDGAVEELARHPDRAYSWKGGLRARWEAADGGMESNIGLLTSLHHMQRLQAGDPPEEVLPEIEQAFAFLERAMDGIYVPYWTYDAETRTAYTGQRGTVYYENRVVPVIQDGKRRMVNQQVAKVRWTPVRGRVARDFDDVLVLGSRSLPKRFTDAVAPWDLSALLRYDPRYLAGFRAEAYGIPVHEAYGEAREIMNGVITGDVRRDIGGDRQQVGKLSTEVGRLTFKHVLLPIWVAAYRYRGKSYRFVVNARTGAVEGERPYSPVKIAIAVLIGLILAIAIAWLQIKQS